MDFIGRSRIAAYGSYILKLPSTKLLTNKNCFQATDLDFVLTAFVRGKEIRLHILHIRVQDFVFAIFHANIRVWTREEHRCAAEVFSRRATRCFRKTQVDPRVKAS